MIIAITGANGFIGSHLTARLRRENREYFTLPHSLELPEMADLLKQRKPDVLIHLASIFIAEHKPEDIDLLVQSNVGFGTRVLEACRIAGVKRIVITGSSWQHAGTASVNLYGALKNGLEAVARYFVDAHLFSVAFLKLYDSFGPQDSRPKLIPILAQKLREGDKAAPLLLSEGAQIVDFTHVDNSVEALLQAARWTGENPSRFQDFRVTGGERMSLREFIGLIQEVAGRRLNIEWGARPYRAREVMIPWDQAPELPGYRPLIGLRAGLESLFRDRNKS